MKSPIGIHCAKSKERSLLIGGLQTSSEGAQRTPWQTGLLRQPTFVKCKRRLFVLVAVWNTPETPLDDLTISTRTFSQTARKEISLGIARAKYKRLEEDMLRSRLELADAYSEFETHESRHDREMEQAAARAKQLEVALRAADEVHAPPSVSRRCLVSKGLVGCRWPHFSVTKAYALFGVCPRFGGCGCGSHSFSS